MELQQQGNAKYVGWTMKFSCRGKDIVDTLQDIAKEMEVDQHEWKGEIRKTRQEFYHLNYYTTKQLLSMRRELGRFKDGSQDQTIKPEVMALLRSISREVNQDIVKEHLYNIILLLEEWCFDHTEDFVYADSEADSDAMTEPYFGHSNDDDVPSEDEREEEEEEAVKMDDLCIEAITLYPHDISLALDYLNDRSDQGKLFEASREIIDLTHVIGDSGMSHEESIVEDGGYGRQDSRASDISPTRYVPKLYSLF